MNGEKILDVSWSTIFKIFLAAFIFYFLYLIRDILILVIFSLIISVLFNPAIDFLTKKKLPRVLSTILIYLIAFGIVGLLIYFIAPIFVYEIQQFAQLLPQYFDKAAPLLKSLGIVAFENFESFTKALQGWLIQASSSIFAAIGAIFGGIFSTLTVFALAIFFSLEEKGIERAIYLLFPKRYEAYILNLWARCQKKVAGWFGSRILSSLFVGVLTYAACKILAIKYATTFALLAGITNIVPIIGPFIAGAIIVIFAALDSLPKALFILIIFTLIQQIEGNILSPILTKKIIGLPPVLVLIALMVGGELWGIMGAILAIPLFGILFEFLKEFLQRKRESEAEIV